jgi:NAD(P)-dependent dehydrogenase (short-subunit alcohol dehydrogenase family)
MVESSPVELTVILIYFLNATSQTPPSLPLVRGGVVGSVANIYQIGMSPGATATPFHSRTGLPQEAVEASAQKFIAQIPMKRFGTPEEMAQAVLFLSTSDSAYILGAEIAVDGGISQL